MTLGSVLESEQLGQLLPKCGRQFSLDLAFVHDPGSCSICATHEVDRDRCRLRSYIKGNLNCVRYYRHIESLCYELNVQMAFNTVFMDCFLAD